MSRTIVGGLCVIACVASATAGDWPQILGPDRNGIAAADESLNVAWGASGPKTLWQKAVGTGFAGAAIRDGKVYFVHRQGENEVVDCLQLDTGEPVWSKTFPAKYVPTITYDDGPRCVPTVLADRLILFSPDGALRCLKTADGSLIWEVQTHEKYRAQDGYFGAGSSPLVADSRVIVNVGGDREAAGVVAFSLTDGRELWKGTEQQASYSSPIALQLGEQSRVLLVARLEALLLDPASGAVVARMPFGKRGPTVNAANPIVIGDRYFLTASYGIGAVYGRVTPTAFDVQWTSDELLSSQYTTPVATEKLLFGVHGRQDGGIPELRCLDPQSQKVLWTEPLDSYATLILAGGKLLVVTVGGDLIVVEPTGTAYREVARATILNPTPRASALPALSKGRLVVRDDETLRCFDLRP